MQMMYQVQLLACVDAIMTCCGDGCEIVSFQLFFILISILAQTKEEPLKRKVSAKHLSLHLSILLKYLVARKVFIIFILQNKVQKEKWEVLKINLEDRFGCHIYLGT